ncbi:glutathione S-transferase family protein [Chondromyces apiculatus]|uniref:GST N-terminal domain-containing protein n=1 Tax=Chondromyces apiculatus DSM 436 TaxID=1192034 RepID=A0A017T7F9_9BACT|nr:glutathione S-transferase family protein [Chondromyces apiculatus]EYF05193.1 Hypothetical protein CAP_3558 [Chondromyces apiculatus DSM 436]
MLTRLYHLPISPWSEKARWALDHHRVAYEAVEHVPLVGDLRLRWLLRKPTGRVSVPVLEDGGDIYGDSFQIARHAEAIGAGRPLFPAGHEAEIAAWNLLSEQLLVTGRGVMLLGQIEDAQTALDALPPGVPEALKPVLAPLARRALSAFVDKYRMRDAAASHRPVLDQTMAAFAKVLADGRRYLVGGAFTYADITMAASLQGVSPVDERYMPVGPGGREAWTRPELVARHPEVLAWRDAVYATHRPTHGPTHRPTHQQPHAG